MSDEKRPTPDGGRVRVARSADGRSGVLEMVEARFTVRFWEEGKADPDPDFDWRTASAWSPKGTKEPWLKFRSGSGVEVMYLDLTPGRQAP